MGLNGALDLMWGFPPGAGGASCVHTQQYDFETAYAAGSIPAEYSEGCGTLTKTDANNIASMSDGKLIYNGLAAGANNPRLLSGEITRAAGLRLHAKPVAGTGGSARLGWFRASGALMYGYLSGLNNIYTPQFTGRGAVGTEDVMIILRPSGAWIMDFNGSNWALRYLATTLTENPYMGYSAHASGAINRGVEYLYLDNPSGQWSNWHCLLTDGDVTPETGATITTEANTCIVFEWCPAASEVLEIRFRRTDDDNCWLLRCDQAAGTVKLFSRIAGTETEYDAGKTQTWTANQTYTIHVYADGSVIQTYINDVGKCNYTSASYNNTETGAKASGFSLAASLMSYPLSLGSTFPEGVAPETTAFLTVGDSKTFLGTWKDRLLDLATAKTGDVWEHYSISASGWTTAHGAQNIDAGLAGITATPSYVLYNLGINDSSALPTEEAFKEDVLYIWDAIHTKWSNVPIYVMRVWSQFSDGIEVTINTWLDDCIAARDFAYAGPDESIWLENGDDGARLTADGLHYSIYAGMIACAQEWLKVLLS